MVINESCEAETAYHLTSYIFEALQGVMVALLFCYTSSEVLIHFDRYKYLLIIPICFQVHDEILNSVRKFWLRFSQNLEPKNLKKRKRRSTTTTFVGSYAG